jgi:hypothetical protein
MAIGSWFSLLRASTRDWKLIVRVEIALQFFGISVEIEMVWIVVVRLPDNRCVWWDVIADNTIT